jgi:4-amino-4-deoxy-L-arabinose transferase-like glycosyltransferase
VRSLLGSGLKLVGPPGTLVALLGATSILCLGWMVVVPAFQAPDENGHFAYVQSLAERGQVPRSTGPPTLSTELTGAAAAGNLLQTQQQPATKPEWSKEAYERYRASAKREGEAARRDGGSTPAAVNPPLYYLWEMPGYWIASGGDLFARVTAMRLWSLPFLLITVAATWLLAGTVFGPRRDLQLAAAAIPALLPMFTFISAAISPDGLTCALWSVAFLLGARVLLRQGNVADVAGLLGAFGLAMATKTVSVALAPAVLWVLGAWLWRNRTRRRLVAAVIVSGVLLLVGAVGTWIVVARESDRSAAPQLTQAASLDDFHPDAFASYVWQFYLPRLPFQTGYPELDDWPPRAYEFWVEKSWGAFGWLEVRWPAAVYWPLGLAGLTVALAALFAVWRRRANVSQALLAFFALATVCLLVGLHLSEYAVLRDSHALINQGRYLFPLISLAGLISAAALTAVPTRARPGAVGAGVGALAVLSMFAIGLTAARFYA